MRYLFILLLSFPPVLSAEPKDVYLTCVITDVSNGKRDLYSSELIGQQRDFIVDMEHKKVMQIIDGMSDEDLQRLAVKYTETDTHLISDSISINKHTLDFTYSAFGGSFSGECEKIETQL